MATCVLNDYRSAFAGICIYKLTAQIVHSNLKCCQLAARHVDKAESERAVSSQKPKSKRKVKLLFNFLLKGNILEHFFGDDQGEKCVVWNDIEI